MIRLRIQKIIPESPSSAISRIRQQTPPCCQSRFFFARSEFRRQIATWRQFRGEVRRLRNRRQTAFAFCSQRARRCCLHLDSEAHLLALPYLRQKYLLRHDRAFQTGISGRRAARQAESEVRLQLAFSRLLLKRSNLGAFQMEKY